MAGWSKLKNGSTRDCGADDDVSNGFKSKDHSVYVESDGDYDEKLRLLFDDVLSVATNEAASRGYYRPVPVMLGDGKPLDLFELFQVVRKSGGFDLVSSFWNFVVKELGFDIRASAAIKLVYFKHLYKLEKLLEENYSDGRLGNGRSPPGGSLEQELRWLLSNGFKKGKDGKDKNKIKIVDEEAINSKTGVVDVDDVHGKCNGFGNNHTDGAQKSWDCNGKRKGKAIDLCAHLLPNLSLAEDCFVGQGKPYSKKYLKDNAAGDDVVILDHDTGKKVCGSGKRKRESLSEVLNWVIQIAKCPNDPSTVYVPPLSNKNDYEGNEFWAQAIRARKALMQRREVNSSQEGSLSQYYQKMHPSMYEDPSSERLRCGERLPALAKQRSCSCCNSGSGTKCLLISPLKNYLCNAAKEPLLMADDSSDATIISCPSGDEYTRHVSVGPRFQAEVPDWTGLVSESDAKWLGTPMWPLKCGPNAPVEANPIGTGRPDTCNCDLPDSVQCVRFHIAENRIKLKIDLGLVFYLWKFDCMGEEISLRWSVEEEKRFKDVVRFYLPSLDRLFWQNWLKYFPGKTTQELVSYFFNVFLVQRRSYQNRVTPKHIDSDDDESEFGSISNNYGHEAVKDPVTNVLTCSENKQCTDFE